MQYLTVVYDRQCGLCTRLGEWLRAQPKMCLYALKHYRHWAKRLSGPALLPLARQAFAILSGNRRRISRWLRLLGDDDLAVELGAIHTPRCHGTNS